VTRITQLSACLIAAALLAACTNEAVEAERAAAAQKAEIAAAEMAAASEAEVVDSADDDLDIPDPIDLPQFEARKNLMRAMGGAGRRVGSSNMDEAREAATQIGEYSLAARHPRFQPEGPEYDAFAIELWRRNQEVQLAMAPDGDRSLLQQALRGQRDACQACHTAYRIEED
jgi:hypothetical protein